MWHGARPDPKLNTCCWNLKFSILIDWHDRSVYGTDLCNRRVIRGYGTVLLPSSPGRHECVVRMFRPVSSSLWTNFMGWITGNAAQFIDPRVTTQVEGRDVVRAEVHIVFKNSFQYIIFEMWTSYVDFRSSVHDFTSQNAFFWNVFAQQLGTVWMFWKRHCGAVTGFCCDRPSHNTTKRELSM